MRGMVSKRGMTSKNLALVLLGGLALSAVVVRAEPAGAPQTHVARSDGYTVRLVTGGERRLAVQVVDATGALMPATHVALSIRIIRPGAAPLLVMLEPSPDGQWLTTQATRLPQGVVAIEIVGSIGGKPVRVKFSSVDLGAEAREAPAAP